MLSPVPGQEPERTPHATLDAEHLRRAQCDQAMRSRARRASSLSPLLRSDKRGSHHQQTPREIRRSQLHASRCSRVVHAYCVKPEHSSSVMSVHVQYLPPIVDVSASHVVRRRGASCTRSDVALLQLAAWLLSVRVLRSSLQPAGKVVRVACSSRRVPVVRSSLTVFTSGMIGRPIHLTVRSAADGVHHCIDICSTLALPPWAMSLHAEQVVRYRVERSSAAALMNPRSRGALRSASNQRVRVGCPNH